MKIDFAEAKAILDDGGIEYGLEYEYRGKGDERQRVELEIFRSIQLPLTPKDWIRLCMRESQFYLRAGEDENGEPLVEQSEYMGGCCGSMGHVQDIVNGWFRDGGSPDIRELVHVGMTMIQHDGEEEEEDEGQNEFSEKVTLAQIKEAAALLKEDITNLDAWQKIALCYHLVKNHFTDRIPFAAHDSITPMREALSIISNVSSSIDMSNLFGDEEAHKIKDHAGRIQMMREFGPALKMVWDNLQELVPDPVEGWAFVDLSRGEDRISSWDNIVMMGAGLAVLASREEADQLLNLWRENDDKYKGEGRRGEQEKRIDERVGLRPVRFSIEEGMVFLDRDPNPPMRWPAGKRTPNWLRGQEPVEDRLYEIWAEQWTYRQDDGNGGRMWYHAQRAWKDAAEYYGDGK